MTDWTSLIGYLITPLTGLIGWFAGTRQRRNTAIQSLRDTIEQQAVTIREYNDRIIQLMDEVQEVRRENAELKAGQNLMMRQMEQLKDDKRKLNEILKTIKGDNQKPKRTTHKDEPDKTQLPDDTVHTGKDD